MTIQNLGSIGEFVAAVATLVTLVYLAVQIRQNTRAVRAGAHQAVSDSWITLNTLVSRDGELARIYRLGREGLDNLNEDERIRFTFMLLSVFRVYETTYYQHRVGAVERLLFRSMENDIKVVLADAGVQQWWRENPFGVDPEFRAHVERLVHRQANEEETS